MVDASGWNRLAELGRVRGVDERTNRIDSLAPLAKLARQGRAGNAVWVKYESNTPITKAELNYTTASGKWQERKWETMPATIDPAHRQVNATLPAGTKVYYLNLIDARELVVSTEHVELAAGIALK